MTSGYALSGEAEADILAIARDSIRQWGLIQAEAYVLSLHDAFQRLAEFPGMGRDAAQVRRGYRRFETGGHIAFYRQTQGGILIVRVLHRRMDAADHL